MGQPIIQTSFNAGEWAPALNARVDLAKYHSGAALLRNFFVDYRGGATTRPGSRYITWTAGNQLARLIPFQASLGVSYILEFGQTYLRFYNNGAPVLESPVNITGISRAAPGVVTAPNHGYINFQRIYFTNVGGMTQVNGNFYEVANATTNTFTLTDQFGNAVNTSAFSAYTTGGTVQRVYTITTPYQATEVNGIKYAQDVNILILCHPNHPPYQLVLNSATNWTISPITFGATLPAPAANFISSTAAGGTGNLAYVLTALDINNQESGVSSFIQFNNLNFSTTYTNTIRWSAIPGATSYNIYKTNQSLAGPLPGGIQFGFAGNVTGTTFVDTNIGPDFAAGPPIPQNPFAGTGLQSLNLTANGFGYTAVPQVVIDPPTGGGVTATAICNLGAVGVVISNPGFFYFVGVTVTAQNGLQFVVLGVGPQGQVTALGILNSGLVVAGPAPANPLSTTPVGTSSPSGLTVNVLWGVVNLQLTNPGTNYSVVPNVQFTNQQQTSSATATAALGAPSSGNPTVPGFVQQRMFLGGPVLSPAQFNLSQPGSIYNYNTSFPTEADNAIQETLTSTTLNAIKGVVVASAGLLILTDRGAWLVNGGSAGAPISALSIVGNPQSYSGSSDLPPIQTPQDILYVQSRGSIVRDLAFNFYLANYVGSDISVLSSHLFYGFTLTQWAWAEEPYKLVWAVRNDGQMLILTFLKDQELVAWTHGDTNGLYKSVAIVSESTPSGNVDAVYTIVQRQIAGITVNYIERFVELAYPNDYKSSWQVDAGLGYNLGIPATTFQGANHLSGQAVTGVADGVVINFTMPQGGIFQFGPGGTPGLTAIASASIVTVGLAFLPQLQTLALDLGEPTVQGKRKKVAALTVRTANALGLSAGKTLATVQPMKDLILGNIGTMSNAPITGLQTTDARMIVDPYWDVFGQYYITQPNPYPASILGVIPEIEVGDDK